MASESAATKASTIGEWRRTAGPGGAADRGVKDEMRCNLLRKLETHETLFPGIRGYEETVLPQIANAIQDVRSHPFSEMSVVASRAVIDHGAR